MTDAFIPTAGEFRVNTETANEQQYVDVAALSGGGYVVAWQSFGQDGSDYGIYAQIYTVDGAPVGGEFLASVDQTSNEQNVSITGLVGGGFVVTYQSLRGSPDDVYAQVFDASGAIVTAEFQVNTVPNSYQTQPDVTALVGGGFVVTWASYRDGDVYGIYGQIYDAVGGAIGTEFQINTYITDSQHDPSVASLTGGGFVVTWASYLQDGSFDGVYAQAYTAGGSTVGGEFQVSTSTTAAQYHISATGLDDGGIIVTWYSADSGGDIFAQRYDNSGVAVGGETQINSYPFASQNEPSVTGLKDGGYVIVWQSAGQDGDAQGIYGQRYDAAGDAVGGEFHVSTYVTSSQINASIAALDNGGFVVTWQSNGQDGDAYGIFAQQFDGVLFGTSADDTIDDDFGANVMDGQAGDDTLKGKGGTDTISGGNGRDVLKGGNMDDTLLGGSGRDKLFGGNDNDTLKGHAGNDKLTGGMGQDTLKGGSGADTFIFNNIAESSTNYTADVIKDFESGIDFIDFRDIASGLTYIGSAGFSGTALEVRAVVNGSDVLVRIDLDGDGSADTKIVLEGIASVANGDFIL